MNKKKVLKNPDYKHLLRDISNVLSEARRSAVRSVDSILTQAYWQIGRRIVEFEQRGKKRADYGDRLIKRLAIDLGERFGRGFNARNLENMRLVYVLWPKLFSKKNVPPLDNLSVYRLDSCKKTQTVSAKLSWSQYVLLATVRSKEARDFYEAEASRGGWSVRQLDRQISTQFYERTLLSRNKAAILRKGQVRRKDEIISPEQEIKDPTVLEFLDLKDEYSESEIEDALIHKLEDFLLEMGCSFTFVARQKRLRIGDEWYRIDLVLYHRKLRCLVLIDLKTGKFTHADAGQMNLYLNYAAERMTLPEENPPVGIILCAARNDTVVHYALGGLRNKVLASQYKLQLPDEGKLRDEFQRVQKEFKGKK